MISRSGLREPGAGGANLDDYKAPLFVAWQITNRCDCDCLHCCEESGPGRAFPGELKRGGIFSILEQIVKAGVPYVAFGGGEPLSHPDIFDACDFLSRRGVVLKIETNGHLIDGEASRRLAGSLPGLKSVEISLDGATKDTHEKIRRKGSFQKTVRACENLLSRGVRPDVVFVPTRLNIHEAGGVIDLASSLGARAFFTGPMMRIGRAALNWRLLAPTAGQIRRLSDILAEKREVYKGQIDIVSYEWDIASELQYRLRHPQALFLILPNGRVKLINSMPFVCGDLRRQSIPQVWENLKCAWKSPLVRKFVKGAAGNPSVLRRANRWVDLDMKP